MVIYWVVDGVSSKRVAAPAGKTAVVFMNLWENAAWVVGPPAKFSVHALNPLADPFMKEPSVAKFKPAPQGYTTPSGQPWPPIDTHAKVDANPLDKRPVDEARVQQVLDMMVLLSQSTTAAEMTQLLRLHGDLVGWTGSVTETSVRAQLVVLRERGWVNPGYSGRQELNCAAPDTRKNLIWVYTTV